MAEWIIAEPGRLVLSGTRFSVRYDSVQVIFPWRIYDDNRDTTIGCVSLASAMSECQRRQAELVAVGLE